MVNKLKGKFEKIQKRGSLKKRGSRGMVPKQKMYRPTWRFPFGGKRDDRLIKQRKKHESQRAIKKGNQGGSGGDREKRGKGITM